MDEGHFDHFSRLAVQPASRRTTIGLAAALGLAGLSRNSELTFGKKKKRKKCRKPTVRCGKACCISGECRFKVKGNRWLLQGDCTITRSIEVLPRSSITIDGQGHTITMSGPKSGFRSAGISVVSGEAGGRVDVVNLAFEGSGMTGPCSPITADPGAIFLGQTSSQIQNVTITNINCGSAISASAIDEAPPQSITVTGTRVTANPPPGFTGVGINFSSSASASLTTSVTNSQFTNASVLFNQGSRATVEGCTLTRSMIGGLNGAYLTVRNNQITEAVIGINAETSGTSLTATGNTMVGGTADGSAGIQFRAGSTGSASGNAISNFDCGIRVELGVTPAIGTNTFPPPANEDDQCLNA